MNDVHHSIDLDMTYRIRRGKLLFEDGVSYSLDEALMVARACDVAPSQADGVGETVRGLHAIKKAFGGIIVAGPLVMDEGDTTEDTANGADRPKTMPAVRAGAPLAGALMAEVLQTTMW